MYAHNASLTIKVGYAMTARRSTNAVKRCYCLWSTHRASACAPMRDETLAHKDVPRSRLADEWITRILLGDGRGQPAKGAYSYSPSRDIRDQPFAERFLLV